MVTRRSAQASYRHLLSDPVSAIVCGVDEAGRGPLAGPVYAAAVVLDPARPIRGLRDSKLLSALARDRLANEIRSRSRSWSVAFATVAEIEELNILHAAMLAMRRAVEALHLEPELALIDGNRCPPMRIRAHAIIAGDRCVPSISAASILAKTARDAVMMTLHVHYPMYGFDQHMGYPTPQHLRCLQDHGPCPEHRRAFGPVRDWLAKASL